MGLREGRRKDPFVPMSAALDRALTEDRRARLVDELRTAPDGLDAQELGRRIGLHPNTVRWHLGVLEDAGGVSSEPAPRHTRGRPRILYRLRAEATAGTRDEYRLLATILSGTLDGTAGGPAAAQRAGRAWGRYLVARPQPLADLSDEEATARVAGLLAEQGFAPETAPGEIRLRRCPFLELAETQPDVVCAVHRGLIDGAFAELGSKRRVRKLDVLPRPGLCVARVA